MTKIFIHGGSSEITKFLVHEIFSKFDEFHIFTRNDDLAKKNLKEYSSKIFFYKNDLKDFDQTINDLKKLPNDMSSILWISGDTGNANLEFENIEECSSSINVNFKNVVLSINFILNNKFKINKNSFVCMLTSVAGLRGRNLNLFYGSSKAALISYMSGLRQRFNNKINILTVIPGYMSTRRFKISASKFLITSPQKSASLIINAIKKKKEIIYIDNKWRLIMLIIKLIPEIIYKKLKF